jgi:hypothetical protein
MPTASAAKPNQSNRLVFCVSVSCMKIISPSTVRMPIGRLMKKTQCQL